MQAFMADEKFQDLVERAKTGDRDAFGALAELERARLVTFARRRLGDDLRATVEPEDVVQDALLSAFASLGRFQWRGEASLYAWLASIVELRIRDLARTARRRPALHLEVDPPQEQTSPSRHLRREERQERLEHALRRLSPEHEMVIRFARLEKIPVSEIAQRMERSPGAVRHLLLRALTKLREAFGDATESFHLPQARPQQDATSGEDLHG